MGHARLRLSLPFIAGLQQQKPSLLACLQVGFSLIFASTTNIIGVITKKVNVLPNILFGYTNRGFHRIWWLNSFHLRWALLAQGETCTQDRASPFWWGI
jgi:hypothetical protein